MENKNVSVVVPAYNEENTIGIVLDELKTAMDSCNLDYEIIAVDDGSSDRTVDLIKERKNVVLIRNISNEGYGASLKHGIKCAQYPIIVIIDGDGTYPCGKISELLGHIKDCDMVVAARTGEVIRIPVLRKIGKGALNIIANYLSGKKIPDLNSGFRAIKKEAILKFLNILPTGFSFTTTITLALLTNSYQVKYVPINYQHRKKHSKFHPIKDTASMLILIIRTILYFNPLKIFVPLSLGLILSGAIVFAYSFKFLPKIPDVTIALLVLTGIQTLVIGLLADLIDKRMR